MENPNEKTNPEREFEVCIEYRLSRIEKITSSAYKEGYDEETGSRFIDASGVDLKKEYEKEHMTPLEMQEAFLEFIPFLMDHHLEEWRKENDKAKSAALWDKVNKIQAVWESLGGWEEEFIEAWEV